MFTIAKRIFSVSVAMLVLSSCSTTLVPDPVEPELSRTEAPDDALIAALRADWNLLKSPKTDETTRTEAFYRYNENMLTFVRRVRYDYMECVENGEEYKFDSIGIRHTPKLRKLRRFRDLYDDLIPAIDVPLDLIDKRTVMPGLGVPVVGVIPANEASKIKGSVPVNARGTVRTLTAIMEFPEGKDRKPIMRLISRPLQDKVKVGSLNYQLAGDASASLEIYWNLTGAKEWRFMGLLNPVKLRDVMGLSCMEQYDPKRIPVILTHGLASDPTTFTLLVNRLVNNPDIAKNYQFWFFGYPTGVAWTITSDIYRKSLTEVRRRVDPDKKNKNWDRMVVVGHSMGGLITHYSQCEDSWRMLETVLTPEAQQKYLGEGHAHDKMKTEEGQKMHDMYFFDPVKAARVIYLATPHRGAPLASYRIVEFFRQLIGFPEKLLKETAKIVTLNEDVFLLDPSSLADWYTSVNQLDAESTSIQGLAKMKVRDVPTHSIIGDRGKGDTPESSDGIVPYWSSHLPFGTEDIVPTGHSVQAIPETADVMERILLEHLKSYGIKTVSDAN